MADETTLTPPEGTTLSFDNHPAALVPTPEEAAAPQPALPSALSTPESHPAANVPMPGEPAHAAPGVANKQSANDSGSYHGVTKQGLAVTGALNAQADKKAQQDIGRFQPQLDDIETGAYNVAHERRQALAMETDALRQHADQEKELWLAQQHFITEQADLEKHAYAQSQVVKQQYLANYEQDLMAARMLAMQSGDPYERMGGAEAFGLIAAHAVQGFLKVGGVNIDVAGQTDRWVNREIAKQQQKVQDARQNANDQLHLYDLARQNAHDDYEARERYRGMVLEGLKAQVGAEAARFNSQLASATAAQKGAEIDAQLLSVKESLSNRQQQLYFQAEQMRINEAAERARNSVAMYTARTGRMQEERMAAKEKEKVAPVRIADPGVTVRDQKTGKVTGIKNLWEINPKAPDAEVTKLTEAQRRYSYVNKAIGLLRELRPPAFDGYVEQYGGDAARRFSEAKRNYERQVINTIQSARHSLAGANLTPQEAQEWKTLLENDSGWQSGSNVSSLAQFEKRYRDEFTSAMNSPYVRPLAQNERDDRAVVDESNDTDAFYNMSLRAQSAQTSPAQAAANETVRVGRNESDGETGFSPSFSTYMKETGDKRGEAPDGQRREITGIDTLVAIIAKPDAFTSGQTVDGQKTDDPGTARNEAYQLLQGVAAGQAFSDGSKPDPETQAYAQWQLQRVESVDDPAKLYNDVASRAMETGFGSPAEQLGPGGDYYKRRADQLAKERADYLSQQPDFPRPTTE